MAPEKLRPIPPVPGPVPAGVGAGDRARGVDIADWRPEDETFWAREGKRVANRNLWISIPSLLCGFAVWLMWGIITVQMANAGFPFTPDQLFSIAAISGLSGATLRITAHREVMGSNGIGQFACRIELAGDELAHALVTVFEPPLEPPADPGGANA